MSQPETQVFDRLEARPKSEAMSLSSLVAAAKASIVDPSPRERETLARLDSALARAKEGRLRVAVLGQFKRGKSTLLNALLGVQLLPTGITPVTAIPTYIHRARAPSLRIEFEGERLPLKSTNAGDFSSILGRYVSELENPGNREKVGRVEIAVDSEGFSDRVVLVDTPGVGSTFLHNSRAAEAVVSDCDAGIFVVSPDPPITEAELGYLHHARGSIPKLFFVLNKVDLLSKEEVAVATSFVTKVLEEKLERQPPRIFAVSARAALLAKQNGDTVEVTSTGIIELERALSAELAAEERAIAFTTGRSRVVSLVSLLLYHRKLERQALLTPEQELVRKMSEFEDVVAQLQSERRNLSDLIAIDRRRHLSELTETTDRLWTEARREFANLANVETPPGFDERRSRERLGKGLEQHFEEAARKTTQKARAGLVSRLAKLEIQAIALLARVREAAADLVNITANIPPPECAFELGREPYWVSLAPANSILDASALAFVRLMPRSFRERAVRRQIASDTERAVLRNVANLEWALRQNVEDAFRRFETSLSEQLSAAIEETRQVMQIALEKRSARSLEVGALVEQTESSIAALEAALQGLEQVGVG